jgi:adenosine deaminase
VTTVPLAELHLHIEGTLEPETIVEFAGRNALRLPDKDIDALRARYEFTDLQSFLDLYYENMATLRTRADFAEMTWRYAVTAASQGVRHAEVFVDPQAHSARGIPAAVVLGGVADGLARAEAELGLTSGILVCVLRDRPIEEGRRMLDEALATGIPILGIGLDSAEVGHPPGQFAPIFAAAREAGLHCVAHAGEEGPPAYIWEALDVLGVERIDHGVRCLENAALVARLVADAIPLTVCPVSNVRLRVVDTLADHPLRRMLDAGLRVTVNSDDPAYFGGYAGDNLERSRAALGLTDGQVRLLAANSVEASFAPEARKAQLRAELAEAASPRG